MELEKSSHFLTFCFRDGVCERSINACSPTSPYRTYDGTCNNLENPLWGRSRVCGAYQILKRGQIRTHTDKKETYIFLIYKEIKIGSVAKSYMMKGFLINKEMRKYLIIQYMILLPLPPEFPYI
jgi:hypothetical protein